ncbi:hypothetical protein C8J57DRAFT_1533631 [Mycena rebaudengoi]|nr:hypothetical protein C8J57DRAFT_1533631 [Mycena rebaudengoi]
MDVRSYLRHPWTCAQGAPSVSTHSRVAVLAIVTPPPSLALTVHLSPSASFDVRLHPLIHSNSLRRATITNAPLFHPPISHSACSFPPSQPAAGRDPFGKTGPPPPPTPPLPPSPPPTCDRDAHQAQHCSTSIATLHSRAPEAQAQHYELQRAVCPQRHHHPPATATHINRSTAARASRHCALPRA